MRMPTLIFSTLSAISIVERLSLYAEISGDSLSTIPESPPDGVSVSGVLLPENMGYAAMRRATQTTIATDAMTKALKPLLFFFGAGVSSTGEVGGVYYGLL